MPMSTAEMTPTIDLTIDNSPVTPTGSPKVSPISMKRNNRITPGGVVAKRLKTKAERNNLPNKALFSSLIRLFIHFVSLPLRAHMILYSKVIFFYF